MTLDDSYREMCLEVENLRASLARKVRHCDEIEEERDAAVRERDEALERVRLLEAEVERVTAREDATRRELAETRIDMRDAERERNEARAEVARLREMAHDFEAMREDRNSAYRRGAEAMREACARWMSEREGISQWVYDDALSALPIPEEP